MTYASALQHLRRGYRVKRRDWDCRYLQQEHQQVLDISFVPLSPGFHSVDITLWQGQASDGAATDWEVYHDADDLQKLRHDAMPSTLLPKEFLNDNT